MARSRESLTRLLEMAQVLGFKDDVEHWTMELKMLDEEEANNGGA